MTTKEYNNYRKQYKAIMNEWHTVKCFGGLLTLKVRVTVLSDISPFYSIKVIEDNTFGLWKLLKFQEFDDFNLIPELRDLSKKVGQQVLKCIPRNILYCIEGEWTAADYFGSLEVDDSAKNYICGLSLEQKKALKKYLEETIDNS